MLDQIKKLRVQTGLGVMQCQKALSQTRGNFEKAIKILKKSSKDMVLKKTDREVGHGLIESYVHSNGRIGALVELRCETDFVAKNLEFKEFAHDLAMQVTASEASLKKDLLKEPFIKDVKMTVADLIKTKIAQIGENIKLKRFQRFEI